jgi:hypothetical protein
MKDQESKSNPDVKTWEKLENITIALLETNSDVQNITGEHYSVLHIWSN